MLRQVGVDVMSDSASMDAALAFASAFGSSTCGEHWDFWEDAHTWFESRPNFGWDDALRHSPQLLAVPLRSKDGASLLR